MKNYQDFEIICDKEFMYQLFIEWCANPLMTNDELYAKYLEYDWRQPKSFDLEKWKQEIFIRKLSEVSNIQELEETLDDMEEIKLVCEKLDTFGDLIFTEKKKVQTEIQKNIESNQKHILSYPPPTTYYLPWSFISVRVQTILSWYQSWYEWGINMIDWN